MNTFQTLEVCFLGFEGFEKKGTGKDKNKEEQGWECPPKGSNPYQCYNDMLKIYNIKKIIMVYVFWGIYIWIILSDIFTKIIFKSLLCVHI